METQTPASQAPAQTPATQQTPPAAPTTTQTPPAPVPPAQASTLEGLTADQLKGLYAKSPELFAGIMPPVTEQKPPPAPAPQSSFDLKFLDGKQIDKGVLDEFTAHATKAGLSQAQFQGEIDFFFKLSEKTAQANRAGFEKWQKEGEAKLKADPELGKDLEQNLLVTKKPLEKFGSKELADKLEKTGWLRDPDLVRMFHNIGKQLSEDSTVVPKERASQPTSTDQKLRDRYPSMFEKNG